MFRNIWPIKLYGTAVTFKCAVHFRIEVFMALRRCIRLRKSSD